MAVHQIAFSQLDQDKRNSIEKEHKKLIKVVNQLRIACDFSEEVEAPLCNGCERGKQASCRGLAPSYLYDLIELTSKHFIHEEMVMLSMPHVNESYEHFQNHRKAHSKILNKLDKLVDYNVLHIDKINTASIYREFYEAILKMFQAHDKAFDDPFLQIK